MHLVLEQPDFDYVLRGADGRSAKVNARTLHTSFIVTPSALLEDWSVTDVTTLDEAGLEPLLALAPTPELILLGCGQLQRFPPPQVMATCLGRGIGIEVMTNAAAARTFNVLAAEGRRVAAGFILAG